MAAPCCATCCAAFASSAERSARENDAARACLRRFGHAVVDGLEVFTAAAPEERERLVAAARAEAAPHRACAAADPTLADALAGWDAVLAELP